MSGSQGLSEAGYQVVYKKGRIYFQDQNSIQSEAIQMWVVRILGKIEMDEKQGTPPEIPFHFSNSQGAELKSILKCRDENVLDAFIKTIEQNLQFVRQDYEAANSDFFQSPANNKHALEKAAKLANELAGTLGELRAMDGGIVLKELVDRQKFPPDALNYLEAFLSVVSVCATEGAGITLPAERGRPTDSVEREVIAVIGKHYVASFGKRPTFSRGTEFPTFVAKIFEYVLPGSPHNVRDNSKIVKAALQKAGVIPSRKK